ncbi:hypothetical protein BDQ12DRAFT_730096 [Crucibulum laeve]|uniref:Uncharacterized protein n=1 Tax=Crucibulum laeve TaxID=68775 RepID=A0A5C3LDV4_9AGAR|nr:hypothetical protein BDQ12DRAFT_730096 [Crucibulum laeve]
MDLTNLPHVSYSVYDHYCQQFIPIHTFSCIHIAKDEFLIVWHLDLVDDDCNELDFQIEELEEILKELSPINPTNFSDFSPRRSTTSGDRSSQLTASTSSPLKGKEKRKSKTTFKLSPEQTRRCKGSFSESSRHSWQNDNTPKQQKIQEIGLVDIDLTISKSSSSPLLRAIHQDVIDLTLDSDQ